jgi:septum formation protein
MKTLVLASGSPRRRELMEAAGYRFEVLPSAYAERHDHPVAPTDLAPGLALGKARDVAYSRHDLPVVLAADTFIALDGAILGKPSSEADARRMLGLLSGRAHEVITGVAVVDAETGREETRAVVSRVWFRELTDAEIAEYVATGEPMDKAGSYAIQGIGALLVARLEGPMDNVVGLPMAETAAMLAEFGIRPEGQ